MKEAIKAWLREHHESLIAFDLWAARRVGAPEGWTLSGYSYAVELAGKPWGKFWRPRIDALALWVYGSDQTDHCRKAFERESAA